MLRIATSPTEGRPWHTGKLSLFARGSPTRGAGAKRLRGWMKESLTISRVSPLPDAFPPPALLP